MRQPRIGSKIEKAATLVMLQPWTPARELPAWTHVPSQPLIRSPLSQFQTSAGISQSCDFLGLAVPRVASLTDRSV